MVTDEPSPLRDINIPAELLSRDNTELLLPLCIGDNMLAKVVPVLSGNGLQKTNNYQSSNYLRRPTKLHAKSSSKYA